MKYIGNNANKDGVIKSSYYDTGKKNVSCKEKSKGRPG